MGGTRYDFTRGPDTDGDGLSDQFEVEILGTDPDRRDTDGDGLNDLREKDFGSSPRSRDTDGDNVPDLQEVIVGTDPVDQDTDRDRIGDLAELRAGTAHAPDADRDGTPDWVEFAQADADGDRLTNGEEIWLGTSHVDRNTDGDELDDYEETMFGAELDRNPRNFDGRPAKRQFQVPNRPDGPVTPPEIRVPGSPTTPPAVIPTGTTPPTAALTTTAAATGTVPPTTTVATGMTPTTPPPMTTAAAIAVTADQAGFDVLGADRIEGGTGPTATEPPATPDDPFGLATTDEPMEPDATDGSDDLLDPATADPDSVATVESAPPVDPAALGDPYADPAATPLVADAYATEDSGPYADAGATDIDDSYVDDSYA